MKSLLFLFLALSSCATLKTGLPEDELFLTRKYVGNFIEYKHTKPERLGDPHIICVKTSLESVYGIISAYSRDCEFRADERLYIRRIYHRTGIDGYWMYQLESDSYFYRISQFQYEDKILVQDWF
jgi:hypothetical protein